MRRRDFLKGAAALPVAAIIPAAAASEAAPIMAVDLASGGDMTVAWRVFQDPITDALRCEPISMRDFYAADDAAMAS